MLKNVLTTTLVGTAVLPLLLLHPFSHSRSLAEENSGRSVQVAVATDETVALEQAVLETINSYRRDRGLEPLAFDATIAEQSRLHSQTMASRQSISHNGFDQRLDTLAQFIAYRSAAENVASNQGFADPVQEAVRGWLQSPSHRENIEGTFNATGIGIVRTADGEYYFTQIFVFR